MKVKDLKLGMLLKPIDDGVFLSAYNDSSIVVGWPPLKDAHSSYYKSQSLRQRGKVAVYVGQRQDLGIKKKDQRDWSNRFVLVEGRVYPIESTEWRKIMPLSHKEYL